MKVYWVALVLKYHSKNIVDATKASTRPKAKTTRQLNRFVFSVQTNERLRRL